MFTRPHTAAPASDQCATSPVTLSDLRRHVKKHDRTRTNGTIFTNAISLIMSKRGGAQI